MQSCETRSQSSMILRCNSAVSKDSLGDSKVLIRFSMLECHLNSEVIVKEYYIFLHGHVDKIYLWKQFVSNIVLCSCERVNERK